MMRPVHAIGLHTIQTWDELRKTVTPTTHEWLSWSLAASTFVLALMTFVSATDWGLGRLVLTVFG